MSQRIQVAILQSTFVFWDWQAFYTALCVCGFDNFLIAIFTQMCGWIRTFSFKYPQLVFVWLNQIHKNYSTLCACGFDKLLVTTLSIVCLWYLTRFLLTYTPGLSIQISKVWGPPVKTQGKINTGHPNVGVAILYTIWLSTLKVLVQSLST